MKAWRDASSSSLLTIRSTILLTIVTEVVRKAS
jgi:hypothetical protein